MTALPRTEAVLRRIVGDGLVATGAQLSVAREGEVVADIAVGTTLGEIPLRTDHLHKAYCATKPVLALTIGRLADAGAIALDEGVRRPGDDRTPVPVLSLLNHSAGLDRPRAIDWRMATRQQRERLRQLPPGPTAAAYSEVGAGLLVEDLIAERTRRSPDAVVEETVLGPLGVSEDVIVDAERAARPEVRRRLSVAVAGLPATRIPMLSERVLLDDVGPTLGGLADAAGMCRLYAGVERALAGVATDGVPEPGTLRAMVAARRGASHDLVLDRWCDFGGGFAVDLVAHGFGYAVSARAVGHVGANGHTVGLADPDAGLAVGLYLNGASIGLTGVDEAARTAIVDELVAECARR